MTIEERLEVVERELALAKRRLLGAGILLVCLSVGFFITQKCGGPDQELHATRFLVIDKNGNPHGVLYADKDGEGLFLSDGNVQSRVDLYADKDESRIALYKALYNGNTNVRARLRVTDDGTRLSLYDENGNERVGLGVDKDGPGLWLYGEIGQVRAKLGIDKDGPALRLYDAIGFARAELGAGMTETSDGRTISHPESSVRLYKPSGKVIWSAP